MRITNAAKSFFHSHKPGSKQHDDPSIFDSSIGDWILDAVAKGDLSKALGK